MNAKIQKVREELEKDQEKLEKLQARIEKLTKKLNELESTEIIGMVRATGLTLDQLMTMSAYSGDSRSPIPMISVHSVGDLLYRRQS